MALLTGKSVLITGALGSIGAVLVRRYIEEGASVIALDLPDMEKEASSLTDLGARYFGCDLEKLLEVERSVLSLADEVGGIDVLVNNAACAIHKPHDDFSIEEYERQLRINAAATFVMSRACSHLMKKKRAGKIVCMTSVTLNGQWEDFVPYVASKGAVYGLVKTLARELGKYGIYVNAIAPGAVRSEAEVRNFGNDMEKFAAWVLDHQNIKRRIEPDHIANLAIFLSTSQSDMISGQEIHCDGGWPGR